MSFIFNPFNNLLATAGVNLATDSLRALIVMTDGTALSEPDSEFIDDITTLDEYDGVNYTRKILANTVLINDYPNKLIRWDFDLITWTTLGPGTRNGLGMLLFKFVNDDSDSPLIAYIDDAPPFPFTGDNNDKVVEPNADGAMELGDL